MAFSVVVIFERRLTSMPFVKMLRHINTIHSARMFICIKEMTAVI